MCFSRIFFADICENMFWRQEVEAGFEFLASTQRKNVNRKWQREKEEFAKKYRLKRFLILDQRSWSRKQHSNYINRETWWLLTENYLTEICALIHWLHLDTYDRIISDFILIRFQCHKLYSNPGKFFISILLRKTVRWAVVKFSAPKSELLLYNFTER